MPFIRSNSLREFLRCPQRKKKVYMLRVPKSHLFHSSQSPSSPSLASILHEIKELEPLQQIHANIITFGLQQNVFLSNRLLNAYFLCGDSKTAEEIFRRMTHKNVVSWTIMVNRYWKYGCPSDSVDAFREMMLAGVSPNSVTTVSVLPACSDLGLFLAGRSVHGYMIARGLKANVYVETAILDMYMKGGSLHDALQVFDRMSEKNVVSWNTMINGYFEVGDLEGGMKVFKKMKHNSLGVDHFTMSSLLCICAEMGCLVQGTLIHVHVIRCGFEKNVHVGTLLMDMYMQCGNVEDAFQVFDSSLCKDVVSWSTMISIFVQLGNVNRAVDLFGQMMVAGISLDSVSLTEYLSLCSRLGALSRGKCLHGLMIKTGFETDTSVGTALMDMYSKCGSLVSARSFFDKMGTKDIICWNAMITGCGINGCGDEAVGLFLQMKGLGLQPNNSTFVSILSACSHARLVDQGLELFQNMVEESILLPNMQHYACMVDLLGRAGHLHAAYHLLKNLPLNPDASVLGSLLNACKTYGEIAIGAVIARKISELDLRDAGYYVLLSNWYAGLQNWDRVDMTQDLLRLKGLKKEPGCSLIEIGGSVHAFVLEDTHSS